MAILASLPGTGEGGRTEGCRESAGETPAGPVIAQTRVELPAPGEGLPSRSLPGQPTLSWRHTPLLSAQQPGSSGPGALGGTYGNWGSILKTHPFMGEKTTPPKPHFFTFLS